jgi:hypothetical protein
MRLAIVIRKLLEFIYFILILKFDIAILDEVILICEIEIMLFWNRFNGLMRY